MKRVFAIMLALALLCLTACGQGGTVSVAPNMNSLYTSMESTLPEMVKLDGDMMLNLCGIKAEQCKQAVVAVANDGLRADEIWLLEAVDSAVASELKAKADNRLKYKGEESITYSPEQYAIVQKAEVIVNGNCLIVIVSPDVDTLVGIYNAALEK